MVCYYSITLSLCSGWIASQYGQQCAATACPSMPIDSLCTPSQAQHRSSIAASHPISTAPMNASTASMNMNHNNKHARPLGTLCPLCRCAPPPPFTLLLPILLGGSLRKVVFSCGSTLFSHALKRCGLRTRAIAATTELVSEEKKSKKDMANIITTTQAPFALVNALDWERKKPYGWS